VVARDWVEFDLRADERGQHGVVVGALLVEPVGVHQPRSVLLGVRADRRKQLFPLAHGWTRPSRTLNRHRTVRTVLGSPHAAARIGPSSESGFFPCSFSYRRSADHVLM